MARRNKETGDNKALKLGMSLFIAFIMVFSVFAVMIGSNSNELKYGKFKFEQDTTYGYYITEINNEQVYFYSFPTEVSFLNISNETISKLKGAAFIVTTFDPTTANDSIQAIELARFDLTKFMKGKQVFNSVLNASAGYESLPVFGCENATALMPIIIFNVSDAYSVSDTGDCIYLNGKGGDFLRFRDRILYSYLGVI